MQNKIIILYDNSLKENINPRFINNSNRNFIYSNLINRTSVYHPNLIEGWGFSCLILFKGKTILFDCGWSGSILLNNMICLNTEFNKIDYIIISHQHWDHIGGLSTIIDLNHQAEIFLPSQFSKNLTNELKKYLKDVHKFDSKNGPHEILENLFITGGLKGEKDDEIIYEQSIGICSGYNQLIISGCLHPSFLSIYQILRKQMDPNILMGGLHGFNNPEILIKSGIKNLYIGHCTEFINTFLNQKELKTEKIYIGFELLI